MKNTFWILSLFLIFSCINKKENKDHQLNSPKPITETKEPISAEENEEDDFKNVFEILLPSQYRDWENKNPANALNNNWIDLHLKNDDYYLSKTEYTMERGFSECSGDSTKIINSKNETLLLINKPNLKLGKVNSLKILHNKIWPEEKVTYNFNGDEYALRAEGTVLSSEKVHTDNGLETYQKVENYQLFISYNNSPEVLFLEQASFNDTFVELLFAGDIDGDGKLDFIFGANRNYEEERVILYLSSDAKNGEIIKKVSEIAIQFDC